MKEENATSSGYPWPFKLERSKTKVKWLRKFKYWFYLLGEQGRDAERQGHQLIRDLSFISSSNMTQILAT